MIKPNAPNRFRCVLKVRPNPCFLVNGPNSQDHASNTSDDVTKTFSTIVEKNLLTKE